MDTTGNGDESPNTAGTGRRGWSLRRRTGLVMAGAVLAVGTALGAAGSAGAAECPPNTILRILCTAPAPVAPPTTPTTTAPLPPAPPINVAPVTLPPVLAPPAVPTSVPDAARRLLDLTNAERRRAGLGQLTSRDDVTAIALAHSERMARAGDIFHSDTFLGAAVKAVLNASARGENVAYNGDIEAAHQRLMASAGHRANILDSRFSVAGFAVVRAPDGRYFITQNFIQPAGAPRSVAARPVAVPAAARPARAAAARPAPAPTPTTAAAAPPTTVAPAPAPSVAEAAPPVSFTVEPTPIASTSGPQPGPVRPAPLSAAALLALVGAAGACSLVSRRHRAD